MNSFVDILNFILICIRNVWRERKISILTILGVFFATLIIIIYSIYTDMSVKGSSFVASSWDIGDFQISTDNFFKNYLLKSNSKIEHKLDYNNFENLFDDILELDEIEIVTPRIYFTGTIKKGDRYQFVNARAGLPENEIFISPSINSGNFISANNPFNVVIGKDLFKKLGCNLNDYVEISSPEFNNKTIKFKVVGTYFNPLFEQKNIVIIPINAIWKTSKKRYFDTIIIKVNNNNYINNKKFESSLKTALQNLIIKDTGNPNIEVKSVNELAVFYKGIAKMNNTQSMVFKIILWILTIFFIFNTLTIVIFNRTKEIAILIAIGNSKFLIIIQFIIEGLIIGIIGATIAGLLTTFTINIINKIGITIPAGIASIEPMKLYIMNNPVVTFHNVLYMIIITLFSSILPALKTLKINIGREIRE